MRLAFANIYAGKLTSESLLEVHPGMSRASIVSQEQILGKASLANPWLSYPVETSSVPCVRGLEYIL